MVALCGNCHPMVAKWQINRQHEIKANPINISNGLFSGALEYDKKDLLFKVGGNWYDNTPIILQFYDKPIISCYIADGQAKISLDLLDKRGDSLLTVKENNVTFRVNDMWDFEYAHNIAVAKYGFRDIALRIDFRRPESVIEGKLWLGENQILLGSNQTNLPGASSVRGGRTSNCNVGIQIGDANASPWQSRPKPETLRTEPKRNSPCPCGSGRHYKHCHGVY